MPEYLQTSIEPYLDSFTESFAAENYKPATINAYRWILRKVGRVIDAEGISPSALTLDMAEQVGRKVPRKNAGTAWPYKLARRFAQETGRPSRSGPKAGAYSKDRRAAIRAHGVVQGALASIPGFP